MRKIISKLIAPFVFTGKAILLSVLFILLWGVANINHFVMKNKTADYDEKDFRDRLNANKALADVPGSTAGGSTGGSTGKSLSTPFLACFDGKTYKLENDILFGRPRSYHSSYEVARLLHANGNISPDLYKIAAPVKPVNGKLLFQIQEIELEESFFKWLELRRIIHPADTEIVVDSEYKKFHVLDKKRFEENIISPASVVTFGGAEHAKNVSNKSLLWDSANHPEYQIKFQSNESAEIVFKNLKFGEIPHLVVKSWFRDWVLGLEEDWATKHSSLFSFLRSRNAARAAVSALVLVFSLISYRKGAIAALFQPLGHLPFLMGSGDGGTAGGTAGGTGDTGSTGSMCCSFVYHYQNINGQYRRVSVSEPRAWRYNSEVIEFPREAVLLDGTMRVKISSSKRHIIGFIGAIQGLELIQNKTYREENSELIKAHHHRLNQDMAQVLKTEQGSYVQTLPGDKIDLEFAAPKLAIKKGERETYLIRASGFYTALRKENRERIGDWRERISEEAKSRLAYTVRLKDYA